jgi:hypothetical protein
LPPPASRGSCSRCGRRASRSGVTSGGKLDGLAREQVHRHRVGRRRRGRPGRMPDSVPRRSSSARRRSDRMCAFESCKKVKYRGFEAIPAAPSIVERERVPGRPYDAMCRRRDRSPRRVDPVAELPDTCPIGP